MRSQTQLSHQGSIGKRPGTPAAEYLRWAEEAQSPTRSVRSYPHASRTDDEEPDNVDAAAGEESFELNDEGFEAMENVRACCDGEHDLGALEKVARCHWDHFTAKMSSADDAKPDHPLTNGVASSKLNGKTEKLPAVASPPFHSERLEDNPYNQIIESLRAQNNELFTQVTALNSKLVQSYDRVSDLEDNDHLMQSQLRNINLRVAELELERMEHLAALDTGLLVEKAHVTTELSRLMERVSEESAQRGVAESAKNEIEKDLDELSATLFNQANTMVAEARYARAQSEKKAASCETALKSAEEAIAMMQAQMQGLIEAREASEREAVGLRETMIKGKWIERKRTTSTFSSGSQWIVMPRLLNAHLPFEEFLLFVAHLRTLRPNTPQPPSITSLISQPFLARMISEDSDPTLRLDLAPSLNWLTRRSIAAAVQQGQLQVEPMQSTQLVAEHMVYTNATQPSEIQCALCGKTVLPLGEQPHSQPPPNAMTRSLSTASSWASTSRFIRSSLSAVGSTPSRSTTAPSTPPLPSSPSTPSHVVYIFRVSQPAPQKSQPYALCGSGWCLTRVRATCELWRFVRMGVIEKVWEEEVSALPTSTSRGRFNSTGFGFAAPPSLLSRKGTSKGGFWGFGALGVDVSGNGHAQTSDDKSIKSDRSVYSSSTSGTTSATPATIRPPMVPRRLPPPPPPLSSPPPPLPARNAARPTSPMRSPGETEEFQTPRTSLEKEDPKPAETVDLNEEVKTPPNEPADEPAKEVAEDSEKRVDDEPVKESPKEADGDVAMAVDSRPSTPIQRPTTPQAIALPASPATPTVKPAQLPGSASPAPPPLPRRAASRRVGTPIRAGTPSPRTSVLLLGKERDGEPLERRNSMSQVIESTLSEPEAQRRSSLEQSPEAPVRSRPASPAGPRPLIRAATPPLPPRRVRPPPPPPPVETVEAEPVTVNTVALPVPDDSKQALVETPSELGPSPVKETETEKDAVDATPHPDVKQLDVPKADSADERAVEPEDEGGIYVGDRTWEERAWRELTKLKAEMFWARIGTGISAS
ncbi:hypothetical protein FRB99_001361 [Tulasnella sp. 403]|nr:hypothetical protein FRB99_001361 [Tulasnella sp. 403]